MFGLFALPKVEQPLRGRESSVGSSKFNARHQMLLKK